MINILKEIKKLWSLIIINFNSYFLYKKVSILYPKCKLGKNIKLFGRLLLHVNRSANVLIGDNVIFRSHTKHNFVGINKPVSIAVKEGADLEIGEHSGFSGTSIYCSKRIIIGKYCNFGGNVFIWDTDFHPLDYKLRRKGIDGTKMLPIIIGDDVFVGANSTILKGVTIGSRSVIAAGSVVVKDVPPDEVWGGNPARYSRRSH